MNDIERARFLSMIEQQRQGLQEPWVDPVSAGAGGFGALLPKALSRLMAGAGLKALARPVASGVAGALSDYPIGALTDSPHIPDAAKLPVNIALGMGTGIGADAMSRLMAQSGLMRQAGHLPPMRNPLANEMGQVDAWHGSPHTFDKFSSARIGTGEGAQAFGHGLYFTDKEEIARHYAGMAGSGNFFSTVDGTKSYSDLLKTARQAAIDSGIKPLSQAENVAATVVDGIVESGSLKKYLKDYDVIDGKYGKYYKPVVESLERLSPQKANKNLYKVTLNKGRDDVWLDWDKPVPKDVAENLIKKFESGDLKLNEDRGTRKFVEGLRGMDVLGKLKGLGYKIKDGKAYRKDGTQLPQEVLDKQKQLWESSLVYRDAGHFYRDLSHMIGSDAEASRVLKDAGLDGIRYPTESLSGKKGSDKFNYVVFDENAVEINDKISY